MIKTITNLNEVDDLGVVAFTASWCVPCKQLKPELIKAAGEASRNIYIVDAETLTPDILEHYNVRSVPTVVMLHGDGTHEYVVGRLKESILDEIGRK